MKIKNMSNKRKLSLLTLLVCLPIFLLVIVINFLLEGPIQDRLLIEHEALAQKSMKDSDFQVKKIEDFASNLSVSLNDDGAVVDLEPNADFSNINRISNQLFLLESNNDFIKKAQIMISSNAPYSISKDGTSLSGLPNYQLALLKGTHSHCWKKVNNELFFLQEISVDGKNEAILIIQLDTQALLQELSNSIGEQYTMVSIGNVELTAKKWPQDLKDQLGKIKGPYNHRKLFVERRPYALVKETHQHLNQRWVYYSMISLNNTFSPIIKFSVIVVLFGILSIIGTFLTARFFNKQYHKPIRELVKNISDGEELDEDIDESQYLHQKWQKMIETQHLIMKEDQKNNEKLKSAFINNVIQERYSYYSPEELLKTGKKYKLDFSKGTVFCFVHISLTDVISAVPNKISNELNLMSFMFKNVVSDVAAASFSQTVEVVNKPDKIVLFANELNKKDCEVFCQQIFENVNKLLNRWVTITIGKTLKQWHDLPRNYYEDERCHKFQRLLQTNQLLFTADMKKLDSGNQNQYVSDLLENKIIDKVRQGQIDEMELAAERYVEKFIQNTVPQLYFIQSVKQLHNKVLRILKAKELSTSVVINEAILERKLSSVFRQNTLTDILVSDIFLPAAKALEMAENDTQHAKISEIILTIQENYNDPNLSLEQMAERYHLDTYNLSREFKARTGVGYIDYVTDLRIEKAKYLLRHSNTKVNDIAGQVGYQPSYFNRIFKRKVHLTPGQYRKEK